MNRLVILDRDGVINRDSPGFVRNVSEFVPIPGSLEAIALFTRAGWRVFVATNQSGVGRGLMTEAELGRIHDAFLASVADTGGEIAGLAYCPHHPDDGCDCRKPLPGLIFALAREYGFDPAGIPVIGDSARDVDAALAAGCQPLLVRTGHGEQSIRERPGVPAFADLLDAARYLLGTASDV